MFEYMKGKASQKKRNICTLKNLQIYSYRK